VKKDVITLQPYQTAEVDIVPREAGLTLFHCHQQMHMEMGFLRAAIADDRIPELMAPSHSSTKLTANESTDSAVARR
jgi:hypothetical protein